MFDALNTDWSFPVEMQPIYDRLNQPIQGNQAVVRTDTNEVLGVHGSRYQVVTHDTVVNSITDAVKAANISADWTLKTYTAEGGRKFRGEILFNDLTVEPVVGDFVKFRISFFNSYDGSWSFQQSADGLRLFCLNGCTHAIATARSKLKHTQSISVDGSADKMALGMQTFIEQRDVWRDWMNVQVSDEMAELFFKTTLAKAPSYQKLVEKTNDKQLERLLGIWHDERSQLGSNKWALYNCMTYWASHTYDLKNPEVARRNREDAITNAMKSKHWEMQ